MAGSREIELERVPGRRSAPPSRGFTLIEIMVAVAASGLILVAASALLNVASRASRSTASNPDLELDVALDLLADDLASATRGGPGEITFQADAGQFVMTTTRDALLAGTGVAPRSTKIAYRVVSEGDRVALVRQEGTETGLGATATLLMARKASVAFRTRAGAAQAAWNAPDLPVAVEITFQGPWGERHRCIPVPAGL